MAGMPSLGLGPRLSLEVVEAGEAPFRDAGAAGQRELLQRVGQLVEAAKTPVIQVGTASQ